MSVIADPAASVSYALLRDTPCKVPCRYRQFLVHPEPPVLMVPLKLVRWRRNSFLVLDLLHRLPTIFALIDAAVLSCIPRIDLVLFRRREIVGTTFECSVV